MENREPAITQLFETTKKWSLDDFREIYRWLGCRFDHDFFESEVGIGALSMCAASLNGRAGRRGVAQDGA